MKSVHLNTFLVELMLHNFHEIRRFIRTPIIMACLGKWPNPRRAEKDNILGGIIWPWDTYLGQDCLFFVIWTPCSGKSLFQSPSVIYISHQQLVNITQILSDGATTYDWYFKWCLPFFLFLFLSPLFIQIHFIWSITKQLQ